jgi:hypothetical protein
MQRLNTESIELFVEDQALMRSYDLVPPRPLPPSPVSKLSLCLGYCVSLVELTDGRGGAGGVAGGGARSQDCMEPGPLHIYHSTSGFWPRVRARALRAPVFLGS